MVSKEKRFAARKAWVEYGKAIVKAWDLPEGSMIVAEPTETFLENSNDDDVEAFIRAVHKQTKEISEMKFLGE